jgi:hypothetical protein
MMALIAAGQEQMAPVTTASVIQEAGDQFHLVGAPTATHFIAAAP